MQLFCAFAGHLSAKRPSSGSGGIGISTPSTNSLPLGDCDQEFGAPFRRWFESCEPGEIRPSSSLEFSAPSVWSAALPKRDLVHVASEWAVIRSMSGATNENTERIYRRNIRAQCWKCARDVSC